MENKYPGILSKNTRVMLGSLTMQFILGMLVNLFAVPPDDPRFKTENPLLKMIFSLHAVNGVILPLLALALLFLVFKSGRNFLKRWAGFGLIAILIAAGGGIATIIVKGNLSEITSLIMSMGFIAAYLSYGKLYFLLKNKQETATGVV